jgi:glycosyltransferase involved in cell wall biosynthesis
MNRKPHLLHVFSTFKVGGPQIRFAALAQALGAEFSHSVIAMDGNYAAAEMLPPAARVTLLPMPAADASLGARLWRYRRTIAKNAADLLVTYNWGAIEWVVANAAGIPGIHIVDGFGPEEAEHRLVRRNLLRQFSLRLVGAVVVPSLTLQNLALREWHLNAARLHYIPNGIAPDIAPLTDFGVALPVGVARIAWAGALRKEKNIGRLLRAFAPLKDRAVLLVIGDGPERAEAESLAQQLGIAAQTHFLGYRENVTGLLNQADIVALSSDTEQMPLVVLEAMAAGRPLASVDVGDVRAMLAAENRDFVVDRSAQALTKALEGLLADPDRAARIGAANRARLKNTYHIDVMVARYRDLIRSHLRR